MRTPLPTKRRKRRAATDHQQTPESAKVLGDHDAGWFGKVGYSDLMAVANAPYKTQHKFEDMYICDPSQKYYGFKSWDGTRPLHPDLWPLS